MRGTRICKYKCRFIYFVVNFKRPNQTMGNCMDFLPNAICFFIKKISVGDEIFSVNNRNVFIHCILYPCTYPCKICFVFFQIGFYCCWFRVKSFVTDFALPCILHSIFFCMTILFVLKMFFACQFSSKNNLKLCCLSLSFRFHEG